MSYSFQITIHMILMILFVVFALSGIIIARFFRKKSSKWLKLHKTFMILSILSALTGFIWILYVVQSTSGVHFTVLHAILGIVTLVTAFSAPVLGFRIMSSKTSNSVKPLLRKIHRFIGWLALVLVIITVFTGLSLFL